MELSDGMNPVKTIAVMALFKNNEKYIRDILFPIFVRLENIYAVRFSYYFLENDSTDATNSVIKDFLKNRKGRFIDSVNRTFNKDAHIIFSTKMVRIEKITYLRNLLLDSCHEELTDADWLLNIDSDIKFDDNILELLFAKEPAKNNIGIISPYGAELMEPWRHKMLSEYKDYKYVSLKHYYDTFALVYENGINTWPNCRFSKCLVCPKDKNSIPESQDIVDVQSCFGGFALIDNRYMKNKNIRWETIGFSKLTDGSAICEHIMFCNKYKTISNKRICIVQSICFYHNYA